jgi:hypothetical protein
VGFRASNLRSDGPEWARAVAAARHECAERPPGAAVTLLITPKPFATVLTCRDLR